MEERKGCQNGGVKLPRQEKVDEVAPDGNKYPDILEYDKVKELEMKEKFENEYLCRKRLILKSKLNERENVKVVNTSISGITDEVWRWDNKMEEGRVTKARRPQNKKAYDIA